MKKLISFQFIILFKFLVFGVFIRFDITLYSDMYSTSLNSKTAEHDSLDLQLTVFLKSGMMVINFLSKKWGSFIGILYISSKLVTLTSHVLQGQSDENASILLMKIH